MNTEKKLLAPLIAGALALQNRVVMAPMNRRRSLNGIPGESAAIYFGQRASAGLIITDNTAVAPNGIGYMGTPGIYNQVQIDGWKHVTGEVHARGGRIFMQLVHAGRIGHYLNNEGQMPLIAPSAVTAEGLIRTAGDIHLPISEPLEASLDDVRRLIDEHIQGAVNAIAAGFDGVEIHGAHGFLPEQFLHPHTNRRTDAYGGSIAARSRFLLEIVEGTIAAIGKERVGIRLSPFVKLNDLPDYAEEAETQRYIVDALQEMGIVYIHLSDQGPVGLGKIPEAFLRDLRQRYQGLVILAGGYSVETAEAALQAGLADLIAFGKPYIANPDLTERFKLGIPLATGDPETYYQGGDGGYIDYPFANLTRNRIFGSNTTADCR
ncbi:N-ethylmaleimide reductase [Dyadobacter soli]|uniref:N-ethylmaleimide reductase n=1 Tax=Dyadobacter soli TaxID=659014 RepID=A0A1G6V5F0_9BACT|nr:alkene reductase [Dyadobacter soli]SDD48663.1 N-ethylmaleimide reductase [Dyadobacter soli]